jgi:hypothetical protein
MMTARSLLMTDQLVKLPYLFFSWLTRSLSLNRKSPADGPVIAIKLMGMGSISRLYSLCRESAVDFREMILITLDRQKEVTALLGFRKVWIIRTTGPAVFCIDVLRIIGRTWRSSPRLIIDFERCSNAVGLFRLLLTGATRANVLSFENISKTSSRGRTSRISIRGLTVAEMFRAGIQQMTKIEQPLGSSMIQIQSSKVLVNCNASDYLLARRYPAKHFAELVNRLSDVMPDLEFYFTGSAHEREYVEGIIKELEADVCSKNVVGKWKLEELCHEMSSCRLFITVDSGPLHLARALDVPTVAIWGPTQPVQFNYRDSESFINCSLHLACAPCLSHPHSNPMAKCRGAVTCMKDMPAEKVWKASMSLLDRKETYRKSTLLPGMRSQQSRARQQFSV